jgi:pyruvate dehydrogenase E2 component (dihydrolipoamide acetyltransferase)
MNVTMPQDGSLLRWHCAEGEPVRKGAVLCEVETDKTVVEIEAEVAGVLARILVKEGESGLQEGQTLAVIGDAADIKPAAQSEGPATQGAGAPQTAGATALVAAPSAAEPEGAGATASTLQRATLIDGRILASPIARRLAAEAGLVLEQIAGSGPGGRIVERDVLALGAAMPNRVQPGEAASVQALYAGRAHAALPITGMRRTIAQRLLQSKQTIPHFYLRAEVRMDALTALRQQMNAADPGNALTLNDFIVRAWAMALAQVPEANVVWAEERVLQFEAVDVGVAVSVEAGLYTPVIRDAERKPVRAISHEIRDAAARAHKQQLQKADYQGGVSSVSNLGMFGVREFAAIINPPQSSILAVGAAEPRMVVQGGAPAVARMMTATLSCDHRVIDGALAARLLAQWCQIIETPEGLAD